MEGVLLRYLSQVHNTITHTVPVSVRTEELHDVIGYLRAMLARVDSSLVEEWEILVNPGDAPDPTESAIPDLAPRPLDQKRLAARIRAEMHQLIRALSKKDFEAAAGCVASGGWDADRFELEFARVFESQGVVRYDPPARRAHWTRIDARGEFSFDVIQTLIDDEGEGGTQIEAEVVLEEPRMPAGPMLRILELRG
jgi:hypothetical protein